VTAISAEQPLLTYINVFRCRPEDQGALSAAIRAETEDVVRHLPGFVSATVHRSVDGSRVTNYAQWSDLAAFQRHMRSEPGRALVREIDTYAEDVDVHVYRVDWILAGAGGRTARALWEAAWSAVDAGDGAALLPLCHSDVAVNTPNGQHRGAQKLVDLFAQQRSLYTDLRRTVDGVVESGDGRALSAELTLSGFPGGSGERLTWRVVETVRVEEGRIVSWHSMLDRTWLIHQVKAGRP
jgi:ketosteroid isomerase-like protein/quinol monooxygenase YgiN